MKSAPETSIPIIKAKGILKSEMEGIQAEFKFYSPAQKHFEKAPLPKVGEVWKLERTLPSGLLIWIVNLSRWWKKTRWWDWTKEDTTNYQRLQYNIEQHQRENPKIHFQIRNTFGVFWHPTLKRLVTTGDGCITKIWDTETGDLLTNERPFAQRLPDEVIFFDGRIINWSSNGEIFAGEKYTFDGLTGNVITKKNLYSLSFCLSNKRNEWRPNSNQYLANNDLFNNSLVFQNGRTNETEKVIDCDIFSYLEDFDWHPKGRFIAVAFKEHNIRIIDIDEAKIIADLSVKYIVGWSLDGKILVARNDKSKDEFVIWDALEFTEKPMPEDMKNELWFKRFFKNISADGLRYIKIEDGKGNIYSLESDELVVTLSKNVTSAAWSPIDSRLLATCGGSETDIWRI